MLEGQKVEIRQVTRATATATELLQGLDSTCQGQPLNWATLRRILPNNYKNVF